jgi:SecD/SecF fusion protein
MKKQSVWKWLILVGLTAWSLMLVTPIEEKVKLGLDLRGGTSFTLQIDTSELEGEAREKAMDRALEIIRNRVDKIGVAEPIIYPEKGNRIVVQIPGLREEDRDRAMRTIKQKAFLEFRMVHEDNDAMVDALFEAGQAPPGFKIVTIEEQGFGGRWEDRSYFARAAEGDAEGVPLEDLLEDIRRFESPPGYDFMLRETEKNGRKLYSPYFVHRRRELTGEYIKSAKVDYHQFGEPIVTLTFDSVGRRKFGNVTSDYAPGGAKNPNMENRRFLAIVLDGTLYSAPFIKTAIHGGEAIIEGGFTLREAQDLSIVLQAGSLPTPVDVVEERGVDPTLGRDSIRSGVRAALTGGVAVVAFMLIYYLFAGVVANAALLLDMLLLPLGMMVISGVLTLFTGQTGADAGAIELPTLTLPGIAGIVLTIGMAVDANVLIFERIREEQRSGKTLLPSIEAGYDKAFSTIFDANITTLLTAVILFWQGSGPVRGFAVTLSAGILVSMYTALVVTRMLFELLASKTGVEKIKMLRLIGETSIDFVGKRGLAAVLSLLVIAGTWTGFFLRGADNFGVDFTGGSSLTFAYDERVGVDEIRESLTAAGVADPFIQYQRTLNPDEESRLNESLELKVAYDEGDAAKAAMLASFGDRGFRVMQTDNVGPQVGEELKNKGIRAIVFALIGIVIYISIRFEFAFAVGAIVALAHDVLITIGVFCLLGYQLSLPIVAALLTIVGYSVNDTIVVFDRIREDLKLMKGKSFKEICNLSINQTLSRTLLTSLTTLLSVAMLLVFGGGAIFDFALALLIGIVAGTYSSIFVATPVVMLWRGGKSKKA